MIRHGIDPFLECSSKGDVRFSAFYARLRSFGNRSIEEIYQGAKIFSDGETYLSPMKAKGRQAVNQPLCNKLYALLWNQYIIENPKLINELIAATGLSDIFGQEGHCCQATELWKLRNETIRMRT